MGSVKMIDSLANPFTNCPLPWYYDAGCVVGRSERISSKEVRKMGYWTLDTEKLDVEGQEVELSMDDLRHIAEAVNQGFTSGEILDQDEEDEENEDDMR